MAWESGFFNSVNGDRLYDAEAFNEIFEGLITSGVYENIGDKLVVSPNTGMAVQIGTGRGIFNKHWLKNTSILVVPLEDADVTLNRYAAITVRVNTSSSVRRVSAYVKYSDFATNPVKPTMTRSTTVSEYCLAYVYIRAGATSITASNIEDTRFNTSLCGWVTGLIEQVDTDTLFNQWDDLFNTWFSGVQDIIDTNVETRLVNALPTSVTVTLSASNWTQVTDGYTQEVTVTNMNTTKSVIVQATDTSRDNYSAAGIQCTSQSTNKLTFKALILPTSNITVKVVHMGV